MKRRVESELLDHLPPADAAAQHSRRDLLRLNRLMGNAGILARALQSLPGNRAPRELLELGAGDGRLLLQIARQLAPHWPGVRVQLLDRSSVVEPSTIQEFSALGWRAEMIHGDVLDWFQTNDAAPDVIIANLFIHHFTEKELSAIFARLSARTHTFVAVEPRRGLLPLLTSRLLWVIGCNAVTRHDAGKSVRAGFVGDELSHLWPVAEEWQLTERSAGVFSHLFIAYRRGK